MEKGYYTPEDINNDLKKYMPKVSSRFNVKFVKISDISTAIIGERFALIVGIEHFNVFLEYAIRERGKISINDCTFYLYNRFDKNDFKGPFFEKSFAGADPINRLKVIDSGLSSKWADLLNGDTKWIKECKKRGYAYPSKLPKKEMDILERYL